MPKEPIDDEFDLSNRCCLCRHRAIANMPVDPRPRVYDYCWRSNGVRRGTYGDTRRLDDQRDRWPEIRLI